jgi:hypothetical protein
MIQIDKYNNNRIVFNVEPGPRRAAIFQVARQMGLTCQLDPVWANQFYVLVYSAAEAYTFGARAADIERMIVLRNDIVTEEPALTSDAGKTRYIELD